MKKVIALLSSLILCASCTSANKDILFKADPKLDFGSVHITNVCDDLVFVDLSMYGGILLDPGEDVVLYLHPNRYDVLTGCEASGESYVNEILIHAGKRTEFNPQCN